MSKYKRNRYEDITYRFDVGDTVTSVVDVPYMCRGFISSHWRNTYEILHGIPTNKKNVFSAVREEYISICRMVLTEKTKKLWQQNP
ncbi:MAG: hypothetical protein Q8O88_04040 [bacterium]|nr:hypothetical protein [bacterium]